MNAEQLIQLLDLQPHPEGGFYKETYRSGESIEQSALPERYSGDRNFSTAIYFLLTADTFSCMHLVQSDELFHFYMGDPIEQLLLFPDGSGEVRQIGLDLSRGQQPQAIVPRGVWQGARLVSGGKFALIGATVAPAFDFADFRTGTSDQLVPKWPTFAELIRQLTHS